MPPAAQRKPTTLSSQELGQLDHVFRGRRHVVIINRRRNHDPVRGFDRLVEFLRRGIQITFVRIAQRQLHLADVDPIAIHFALLQMLVGRASHPAAVAVGISTGADNKVLRHPVDLALTLARGAVQLRRQKNFSSVRIFHRRARRETAHVNVTAVWRERTRHEAVLARNRRAVRKIFALPGRGFARAPGIFFTRRRADAVTAAASGAGARNRAGFLSWRSSRFVRALVTAALVRGRFVMRFIESVPHRSKEPLKRTRLVRFGSTRGRDVWVHGDLPVAAVDERAVDRLLGLVVEGSVAVRDYATRSRSLKAR